MKNKIDIHLHAKDVVKTKEFYKKLGFRAALSSTQNLCGFSLDPFESSISVLFHNTDDFKQRTRQETYENNQNRQLSLSIRVNSKAELYELADKVKNAGGNLCSEPFGSGEESMAYYAFDFIDIDGYHWDVVYEDITNL